MFEQSGTFKNEFIKQGVAAEDYDIQNNFGETDHIIDLFAEIDKAFIGRASIFDQITPEDLILAFFPCIYFCENSQLAHTFDHANYQKLEDWEKVDKIIERSEQRQYFYKKVLQLIGISLRRGLRLIIENPSSPQHYLRLAQNFVAKPTIIDNDRTRRGDYYKKPTAYWYFNCEPTTGESYTKPKEHKRIESSKSGIKAGICSEERSLISPDYARNFICDFILGRIQSNTITQLKLDF